MPLYEYSCKKCKTVIEKIQKFSDPPLEVCEKCGGPLVKLMGSPALQFKGSGFYITDYAKKGRQGESGEGESKTSQTQGAGTTESSASGSTSSSTPSSPPSTPSTSSSPSPAPSST